MGRIIGLTGFAQSGKDTAAGFLIERGWTRLAFADILRESLYNLNPIVSTLSEEVDDQCCAGTVLTHERVQQLVDRLGWDTVKVAYPEVRALLQRFGTEVGRALYGQDFWVDMTMSQIKRRPWYPAEIDGNYVITDVRFPNEEFAVHNAGGLMFRIDRGTEAVNAHASEMHVATMNVDGVIHNTGDLARYEREVLKVTGA